MSGNLKWRCEHCTESYRIEKPSKRMTKEVCSHRIHGKTCGQPFYHGLKTNTGPATMIVWPRPEEPVTERDILAAARHVRDIWALDQRVHYKQLFQAVTALCKAVNAAEGKT